MKRIIIIAAVFAVSCSSNVLKPDLQSKALYRANIILQDDHYYGTRKPFALYFKKLDNPADLKKGTIIRSDMFDENNYNAVNVEPGVYTIVAAAIYWDRFNILVVFNEDTMKSLKLELKAGETKTIDTLHVMFSNGYILGKSDDAQMYNLEQISKTLAFMPYDYRPGFLDHVLYPTESTGK
ncbi:MAG TPA: hypothetical protein PKK43_02700 [Spirochaetota bacterium]|nr:hypothetical protein [Spirochaetota bacterium]